MFLSMFCVQSVNHANWVQSEHPFGDAGFLPKALCTFVLRCTVTLKHCDVTHMTLPFNCRRISVRWRWRSLLRCPTTTSSPSRQWWWVRRTPNVPRAISVTTSCHAWVVTCRATWPRWATVPSPTSWCSTRRSPPCCSWWWTTPNTSSGALSRHWPTCTETTLCTTMWNVCEAWAVLHTCTVVPAVGQAVNKCWSMLLRAYFSGGGVLYIAILTVFHRPIQCTLLGIDCYASCMSIHM